MNKIDTSSLRLKIDEDIELHLLAEEDAQVLFGLIEQNRTYLREWLPWLDFTSSVKDERAFIRHTRAQADENKSFSFSIWYKGQVAGTIGYHEIDWMNRKVEVGYWLGAQFQGKGLMTKACKALITYAFDELQLNKIEIRCATGNRRSCAIPQRLGFTREGVIRQAEWLYDHFVDLILYGMLVSEWQHLSS